MEVLKQLASHELSPKIKSVFQLNNFPQRAVPRMHVTYAQNFFAWATRILPSPCGFHTRKWCTVLNCMMQAIAGERVGSPAPSISIRHLFHRFAIALWRGNASLCMAACTTNNQLSLLPLTAYSLVRHNIRANYACSNYEWRFSSSNFGSS